MKFYGIGNKFHQLEITSITGVARKQFVDTDSLYYVLAVVVSTSTNKAEWPGSDYIEYTIMLENKTLIDWTPIDAIHPIYEYSKVMNQCVNKNQSIEIRIRGTMREGKKVLFLLCLSGDNPEKGIKIKLPVGYLNRSESYFHTYNRPMVSKTLSEITALRNIMLLQRDTTYHAVGDFDDVTVNFLVRLQDKYIMENYTHGCFFHPMSIVHRRQLIQSCREYINTTVDVNNMVSTDDVVTILVYDNLDLNQINRAVHPIYSGGKKK